MSPRSLRRAAERQAAKMARRQTNHDLQTTCDVVTAPINEHQPGRSHATGPRTAEGKAVSCLNNLKHGLTGAFRVIASESQECFDVLRDALRTEHVPATPTEILLVDRLAEHAWLSQRAQRLADAALTDFNEKWFALMLRYRTTNDRAFHKCLAELRSVRREREQAANVQNPANEPNQFESQNAETAMAVASPHAVSDRQPVSSAPFRKPKHVPHIALDRISEPAAVAPYPATVPHTPSSNRKNSSNVE